MKVFAASVAATASLSFLPSTHAWWDNGHMLVGEVATQLMDSTDVATIESILKQWDEDFPNNGRESTTTGGLDGPHQVHVR
ncbi:hypothetical protein ON010_g5005 [Phytophthora cinnamomi]|nr:hypothetical protein ON010_g5005 [Phytophthora cinnamomi]